MADPRTAAFARPPQVADRPQPRFHYGRMPASFTPNATVACHRQYRIGGGPTTGLNRFGYFVDEACRPHRMWPDNTRVEVTRIAQRAFEPYPKIREGGMKGCWFFLAAGSQVWISVGRTLMAGTRARAALELGLAENGTGQVRAAHAERDLDYVDICTAARRHGYDTIQYLNTARHRGNDAPEIVNCHDSCVLAKKSLDDACTGIPKWNATGDTCWCENRLAILNCAGGPNASRSLQGFGFTRRRPWPSWDVTHMMAMPNAPASV